MSKKNSSSKYGSLILIGVGLVLIVGFTLWQVINFGPASTASSSNPADLSIPYGSVQRVKLADAKAALDQKSAIFVDVRDADVFKTSHLPGALNVPLAEFQARLREMDPSQWIITYCT